MISTKSHSLLPLLQIIFSSPHPLPEYNNALLFCPSQTPSRQPSHVHVCTESCQLYHCIMPFGTRSNFFRSFIINHITPSNDGGCDLKTTDDPPNGVFSSHCGVNILCNLAGEQVGSRKKIRGNVLIQDLQYMLMTWLYL